MDYSHPLRIVLILSIVFFMGIYIIYKQYSLKNSDSFVGGIVLGETDEQVMVDRSIDLDTMTVDNLLSAKNIDTNSVDTRNIKLLKLCGPGQNNCITTDEVKMDKNSLADLNKQANDSRLKMNRNVDRLTESITSVFNQTVTDITQNRSLINSNIQKANGLINNSNNRINDMFRNMPRINSDTVFNLQKNINDKQTTASRNHATLQNTFNGVKNSISQRIANLERRFAMPPRKLWILFGPYRVGYQVTYTLPYSNYPNMTFTPNVTVNWTSLSGLRCNAYPLDPTTAPKNLYGVELLKPNGEPFEKGSFGHAGNKFYIRIGGGTNQGKICKVDTQQNVLVPVVDPGVNRGNEHYFYFTASHHPSWYYMRSSLNNYAAIHNHHFIRFTATPPQQTVDDAFLWMIV